ncbi:MAG: hypothetical protein AB1689_16185, partial [Thermodesulfobacteriota bacterium]
MRSRPSLWRRIVLAASLAVAVPIGAITAGALPTDLSTYVLFAEQSVFVGQNSVVIGNVGVNQPNGTGATIGRATVLAGDSDLAAAIVRLNALSSIDDLFANVIQASTTATVRGATMPFGNAPILVLPPLPSFNPGSMNVVVPAGQTTVLPAGAYGRVLVGEGATLELTGGTYDFRDVLIENDGALHALAAAEIKIAGNLRGYNRVSVGADPNGALPPTDVELFIRGTGARFGLAATLSGIFFGSNATFAARNALALQGQIVARRIEVHPGAVIGSPTPTPTPTATVAPP